MVEGFILAVESSASSGGGAALVDSAGNIIHEELLDADMRGGAGLALAARMCLERMDDGCSLAGLAVDVGPGSFTGLRVGVMLAKSFAWARQVPLIGVHSLDALAYEFRSKTETLAVLFTARRNELYFAIYDCRHDGAERRGTVAALSPAETTTRLADMKGEVSLLGSGVGQLAEEVASKYNVLGQVAAPAPGSVGALGAVALAAAPDGHDLHSLQPVYPRRAGVTMPVLGEPVEQSE